MIHIDNLTFRYKRNALPVLSDFSLNIPDGGIYGLLGRNGAGKSTLLYLIAGLLKPDCGTVNYNGYLTRKRRIETLRDIFIVPEEFSMPAMSLKDFVKVNSRFYPRFSLEDMKRHLENLEVDSEFNLGQLSMGQKKKVFMSFALACNTSLLLLDEPTNGLDIPGKSRFRKAVVSAMNDERTIIISTHQVRDIDKILDHIIITDNHRVLLDKSVSDILTKLKFLDTDSRELIDRAVFARSSVNGSNIIIPNSDGDETSLNIETLFEFALQNPDLLQSFFTVKNDDNE